MSKYLLGIDVGTSSLKVGLIDEDAKLVELSSSKYALLMPAPDAVQIDSDSMWRALLACLAEFKQRGFELEGICGISISSLCPGLVALDKQGQVLVDPIIYSDRRSTREAEEILQAVGTEELFAITANSCMAGAFSGSSMLWIKHHLPAEYAKTRYFGHLNTLLASRMTGCFALDYSNASYSNLFETTGGRKWSEKLCEKIGIDIDKLPSLHESTEVVGELCDPELIALGVKKGTPVVIGGADTPCASIVAGVVRAGDVCESVGTTDVLTVCIDKPVFGPEFINRCHVVPGTWIYQGAMSFTGAANAWVVKELCKDLGAQCSEQKELFLKANEDASLAAPGCGGVVFLPYMLGERSPIWDAYARSVFYGISLSTTRADLNRAVLESCGYGLRQMCSIAEGLTGQRIEKFSSIGGGAKSSVWAQIKADITGREITVLDMNDMAPVGAALLAGVGVGVFSSIFEASAKVEKLIYRKFTPKYDAHLNAVYDKNYATYLKLYPALKDLYRFSANVQTD
ncbi:MAG: sugar kinase [Succinivibrio sp.]|nr:sugar kinase [Succinivibrio sp.]